MRDEHKIILSTYYIDPKMDPSQIPDDIICVSMDITQLLFLMKLVFGESEFSYSMKERRIKIVPQSDRKSEYESMVVQSNIVLRQGGIIEVKPAKGRGFDTTDYLKIGNDSSGGWDNPKSRLYFSIILTKWFNCGHKVSERGNVSCYYLFSTQGGKEFLHYLLYMVLGLLKAYKAGDVERAKSITYALNKDLDSLEHLYNKVEDVLTNMAVRNTDIKEGVYQENFFINQYDLSRDWIEGHQTIMAENGIWEFMFWEDNNRKKGSQWKIYAIKLIYHIEKINEFFLKKRREEIRWVGRLGKEPDRLEFYHLDNLIAELEIAGKNKSWDKEGWIGQYITRLLELIKVIERRGNG